MVQRPRVMDTRTLDTGLGHRFAYVCLWRLLDLRIDGPSSLKGQRRTGGWASGWAPVTRTAPLHKDPTPDALAGYSGWHGKQTAALQRVGATLMMS